MYFILGLDNRSIATLRIRKYDKFIELHIKLIVFANLLISDILDVKEDVDAIPQQPWQQDPPLTYQDLSGQSTGSMQFSGFNHVVVPGPYGQQTPYNFWQLFHGSQCPRCGV